MPSYKCSCCCNVVSRQVFTRAELMSVPYLQISRTVILISLLINLACLSYFVWVTNYTRMCSFLYIYEFSSFPCYWLKVCSRNLVYCNLFCSILWPNVRSTLENLSLEECTCNYYWIDYSVYQLGLVVYTAYKSSVHLLILF